MRKAVGAGVKLNIVFVHPSRLFTEGLAGLLHDTDYRIAHQIPGPGIDYRPEGDEKVIFIAGGRSPAEIVDIVKTIRSQAHSDFILVINSSTSRNDVMSALEAGADGYLRDAISSQTFVRAIELIIEDESVLPPEFVKSLREPRFEAKEKLCGPSSDNRAVDGEIFSSAVKLSAREGSILKGLVDGAPNKVIAQRLQITEATVKVHVKAILRKIRVKNRTQAAMWGAKHLAYIAEHNQIELTKPPIH